MMLTLAVALSLGGAEPLDEAARALIAGRLDQAGEMIAAARQRGTRGEAIDRLQADHQLASGATEKALVAYRALLALHPEDLLLLERAGKAALKLGRDREATALLDRATLLPGAGWRAWNLRGVAADRRGAFDEADSAYLRAFALAPGEAALANNRGWSLMLRGRWVDAEAMFITALTLDPKVAHGAANLELARAGTSGDLPSRNAGESDAAFAARLNDAGVLAAAVGDHPRALAAFTQAIDARSNWFGRAAENLHSLPKAAP